MKKSVRVLRAGRRASCGRFPLVEFRTGCHTYRLTMYRYKAVLVWSPWHGYRLEAWSLIVRGTVKRIAYLTY